MKDWIAQPEVRGQGARHLPNRMNVTSEVVDYLARVKSVLEKPEGAALPQPPSGCGRVEGLAVELIDDQDAFRLEQRREMGARILQRFHVVQRDHGDRSVESPVSFDESDRLDRAAWFRSGIDGRHLITRGAKCLRELAVARSDLEHASWRGRQRRSNEGQQFDGQHNVSLAAALIKPPVSSPTQPGPRDFCSGRSRARRSSQITARSPRRAWWFVEAAVYDCNEPTMVSA